jgi:hypothetical protein
MRCSFSFELPASHAVHLMRSIEKYLGNTDLIQFEPQRESWRH